MLKKTPPDKRLGAGAPGVSRGEGKPLYQNMIYYI
jgi:hypothetical protein